MQAASPADDDDLEVVVLFTDVDVRQRVRAGLARHDYRVAQPERLVEWVQSRRPRVLVVTGDDTQADRARVAVTRAAPEAALVVLTDQPTPARYRELLRTCTAVLPVSATHEDVAVAVAGAWRELSCLPISAVRSLAEKDSGPPSSPRVAIPPRDVAWLRALADGATVAGVARSAGYSPREMYRLLGALYARLGTTNRTEALLCADRLGLLAPALGNNGELVVGPVTAGSAAPTPLPTGAAAAGRSGPQARAPQRGRGGRP